MARELEALIPETIKARDAARTRAERKEHQLRLRSQRTLLAWCKTRVGYVEPEAESALDVASMSSDELRAIARTRID